MRASTLILAFATGFVLTLVAPMAPIDVMSKFMNAKSADKLSDIGTNAAATALNLVGMQAMAAEVADEPLNLDNIIKFDDNTKVTLDSSVSRDVLSRTQVRKIAMGKITTVDVVTTSTGTYSTDGLKSLHVQYPGVEVDRSHSGKGARVWVGGIGWTSLNSGQSSFVYYGDMQGGGAFVVGSKRGCYFGTGFAGCS